MADRRIVDCALVAKSIHDWLNSLKIPHAFVGETALKLMGFPVTPTLVDCYVDTSESKFRNYLMDRCSSSFEVIRSDKHIHTNGYIRTGEGILLVRVVFRANSNSPMPELLKVFKHNYGFPVVNMTHLIAERLDAFHRTPTLDVAWNIFHLLGLLHGRNSKGSGESLDMKRLHYVSTLQRKLPSVGLHPTDLRQLMSLVDIYMSSPEEEHI